MENNKKQQSKKKRNILLATLIPVGTLAIASAIAIPLAISCSKSIKVDLTTDSPDVKIKEAKVEKGKDSTITLDIPSTKEIDSLEVKVDGKPLTIGTEYTLEGNVIKIKGEAVTGNISIKVTTKDIVKLSSISVVSPTTIINGQQVTESDVKVTLTYSDQSKKENAKYDTEYKLYKTVDGSEVPVVLPFMPTQEQTTLKVKAVEDSSKTADLIVNVITSKNMIFNKSTGYTSSKFEILSKSTIACDMNIVLEEYSSKPYVPKTFTLEEQTSNALIPIKSIANVYLDNEDITNLCSLSNNEITFSLASKTLTSTSKITLKLVTDNDVAKQAIAKCEPIVQMPYVEFVGNQAFTLSASAKYWDGKLEYSPDGSTWTEWDGSDSIYSSTLSGGKAHLYLRSVKGSPNKHFAYEQDGTTCYTNFILSSSESDFKVDMNGNAMNLLNGADLEHATMDPYCFYGLFANCSSLISPPELPATTLADHCYSNMFESCTALKSTPALPAKTLAKSCYENMFIDCKNLDTIPSLPATTLAESCYENMFASCKALTSFPNNYSLPATQLSNKCYFGMFMECSGLASLPENLLPAGKNGIGSLAEGCYGAMFESCSNLKIELPEKLLPATALTKQCYYGMFNNTGITGIPENFLPAGKNGIGSLAEECYGSMFFNCKNLTSLPTGLLPATTLAKSCYSCMFQSCENIESTPALPSTKLDVEKSYFYMFCECTNLKKIGLFGNGEKINISGDQVCASTFSKCTNLKIGEFKEGTDPNLFLKTGEITNGSVDCMFEQCIGGVGEPTDNHSYKYVIE